MAHSTTREHFVGAQGARPVGSMLEHLKRVIARYMQNSAVRYEPFTQSYPDALMALLRPGDILLVEGNDHISGVIKYLTQSIWSHAALYVGPVDGAFTNDGESHVLIEAYVGEGVISAPLSKYFQNRTRVCRPVELSPEDCAKVCSYAIDRVGFDYDVKNIIDLLCHLMPLPILRSRRHQMISFGSGDPTRVTCSALIAQAFENVRYPILPKVTFLESAATPREILEIRHSSHYAPRDFDISPYFRVVKPTIEHGFDYKKMRWADLPRSPEKLTHEAALEIVPKIAAMLGPQEVAAGNARDQYAGVK